MKFFFLILFCFSLIYSQSIKIEGIIKQPQNEKIRAVIIVNDTIEKLSKVDSTNFVRNKIYEEKKLITVSDDEGKFTIYASKPNDTIFFKFGRLFHPEKYSVDDLLKNNEIELFPKSFPCISEKRCNQKTPSKLFAFVGTKLDVTYVDTSKYCELLMDSKFNAIYEIVENFSDEYPKSTMQFTSYDHNSMYQYLFPNFENILIFVGEFCGDLYHIKYQFYPVYKTKNGKWATIIDKKLDYYKNSDLAPQEINFEEGLSFDFSDFWTEQQIEWKFPKEYYKIIGNKALPIKGIYVEDLAKFKLEKIKNDYKQ